MIVKILKNHLEDVEENEIYLEGKQFQNPEDMNNYNMDNNDENYIHNADSNNEENIMENNNQNDNYEEEEYKYGQDIDDYKNLYQFQDVIEEEENENNKKKLMDSNYNTFKTEKSASIKRPKSHGKLFLENIKSNKRKESGKIEQKEFPNLKIPNLLYTKENNKALTETNKISNESDIKDKIKL